MKSGEKKHIPSSVVSGADGTICCSPPLRPKAQKGHHWREGQSGKWGSVKKGGRRKKRKNVGWWVEEEYRVGQREWPRALDDYKCQSKWNPGGNIYDFSHTF